MLRPRAELLARFRPGTVDKARLATRERPPDVIVARAHSNTEGYDDGRLWTISDDEFDTLLHNARELQKTPSGTTLVALVRPRAELVIERRTWNVVAALARVCRWEPAGGWIELSAREAPELADGLEELRRTALSFTVLAVLTS